MSSEKIARRLREARIAAGHRSARAAAEALGVTYPTYASHENGHRAFDNEAAAQYARRFHVSLDWLLTGRGLKPVSPRESLYERHERRLREILEKFKKEEDVEEFFDDAKGLAEIRLNRQPDD